MTDTIYLLAVAGILVTILSLWAHLWYIRVEDRGTNRAKIASLGLYWIYMAILSAMFSIAFTLIAEYWEGMCIQWRIKILDVSFGFFITSFIMGLANIGESTLSTFIKGWKGMTASDYLGNPNQFSRSSYIKLSLIALLILIVSLLGVKHSQWFYCGYSLIAIYEIVEYIRIVNKK